MLVDKKVLKGLVGHYEICCSLYLTFESRLFGEAPCMRQLENLRIVHRKKSEKGKTYLLTMEQGSHKKGEEGRENVIRKREISG